MRPVHSGGRGAPVYPPGLSAAILVPPPDGTGDGASALPYPGSGKDAGRYYFLSYVEELGAGVLGDPAEDGESGLGWTVDVSAPWTDYDRSLS